MRRETMAMAEDDGNGKEGVSSEWNSKTALVNRL